MTTTIDIKEESETQFSGQGDSEKENETAVVNKGGKCTVIPSTNGFVNLESQDCIDTDDSGQNIDENSKYHTESNQNCANSKEENDKKDEDLEDLIETGLENIDTSILMVCPEKDNEPNAEPMFSYHVKGAQEGVPNNYDSITDHYQETNIEARHSSAIDYGSHNNEDQSDEPDQQTKQNYTTDNDSVNINYSVFVNIQQSDSHLNGGPTQEFSDNDSKGRHQDEAELPTIAEDVFGMNATFDTKKGFKEEQETVNEPTCVFEDVSHPDGINLHTTIHKSDLLGNRDQAQECPDPVSPKDYTIDEENEIKSCDISKAAGYETTFSTDNKVEHVLDEQIDEEPEDLSTSKMMKISSDSFGDIQVKKTEESVMVQTEKEVVCTQEKRRRFCFPNVPFTKSQIIFMSLFIQQAFSLVQQLHVHPKSVEQTSLTCVKYHNSTHSVEVCVYALGYSGPTYVPPDIPPNEPPNLPQPNLIQTINQQVMAANVAPGVRARMPQRRHVTNDERNISLAVARNRMNRIESTAGDVAAGTSNSYISLRDNPLSISIRHEINHSTLPLPPTSQLESVNTRESNVSENDTNLPSTVPLPPMTANSGHSTVSENNTHLPGAGTCSSRRANDEVEKLPCGEIQSAWISADGVRTSVEEVPRQSENPQMSDSDTQSGLGSSLLNMTQSSTPLPDVPLGMSNQTARADTFRDLGWPHSYLTPMQMSSAGLYYTGVQDVVKCFYCGNCLNSWNLGDDALEEHAKAYPDCNFIILCLRDASRNENHSRAQNGAVGEQDGLRVQSEELIPNDTGGTNREQPHMQRRCAYAQDIEEQGQRIQVMNRPEALDPHDESGRGAQNRINSGSETAWGRSETAVNSLEPPEVHAADDIQHHNDDTEEVVCAEESAYPRQQGRDGVCNTNGTPSLTTATRRRAGSQMRQSSADNEAAQRNPVQQRQTGILSAVMSQRRRVINQPEQHRLIGTGGISRSQIIEDFLDSPEGRLLLDKGFSRTQVAHAAERVLQGSGPLTLSAVIQALVLCGRLRFKKKKRSS